MPIANGLRPRCRIAKPTSRAILAAQRGVAHPNDANSQYVLGDVMSELNRIEDARVEVAEVERISPQYRRSWSAAACHIEIRL